MKPEKKNIFSLFFKVLPIAKMKIGDWQIKSTLKICGHCYIFETMYILNETIKASNVIVRFQPFIKIIRRMRKKLGLRLVKCGWLLFGRFALTGEKQLSYNIYKHKDDLLSK